MCFSWRDLNISAFYFQQTLWLVSFTRDKYKIRGLQMPLGWYLAPRMEVRWLVCLVFLLVVVDGHGSILVLPFSPSQKPSLIEKELKLEGFV